VDTGESIERVVQKLEQALSHGRLAGELACRRVA
jgi:hypothetical protein